MGTDPYTMMAQASSTTNGNALFISDPEIECRIAMREYY